MENKYNEITEKKCQICGKQFKTVWVNQTDCSQCKKERKTKEYFARHEREKDNVFVSVNTGRKGVIVEFTQDGDIVRIARNGGWQNTFKLSLKEEKEAKRKFKIEKEMN